MAALDGCHILEPGTCAALDCAPPCNNQQYTIGIDSANRDVAAYPNTNDFVMELKTAPQRLPTCQIMMGSVEIPQAQCLIEDNWKRLFFNEGFGAMVRNDTDLVNRQITIQHSDPVVTSTIEIPMWLNPIDDINENGGGSYTFTTRWPHGLGVSTAGAVASAWRNWGSQVTLLYNDFTTPFAPVAVDGLNPAVTIDNNLQFTVTGLTAGLGNCTNAGPPFVTAPCAWLWAPRIASPQDLVDVLNLATQEAALEIPDPVLATLAWSYNASSDKVTLTQSPPPTDGSQTLILNAAPTAFSLPTVLGFTAAQTALSNSVVPSIFCGPRAIRAAPANRGFPQKQQQFTPFAANGEVGCWDHICLQTCCQYENSGVEIANVLGLSQDMMLQWNRFNLDCGCPPGVVGAVFVFSDRCGDCYTINIPCGLWTLDPDTGNHFLAVFLQDAMNDAMTAPNDQVYTVQWDAATGQFTFSSTDASTGEALEFGLEFDNAASQGAPTILGFRNICYRGATSYTSPLPVQLPIMNCMPLFPDDWFLTANENNDFTDRVASWSYQVLADTCRRRFEISACKPRCFTVSTADMTLNGTTLTVAVAQSPGFQIGDVVCMTIVDGTTLNTTYMVPVIDVRYDTITNQFEFDLDIGSIQNFPVLPGAEDWCFCLCDQTIFNLNFSLGPCDKRRDGWVKPDMLGFPAQVLQWGIYPNPFSGDVTTPPFVSQNQYCVTHPRYILLQLLDPSGSQLIQHQWQGDNIPNVFAKLIVGAEFIRVERLYPMQLTYMGNEVITKLRFRLLNPDHSLYEMHGKDWSATLIFGVPEKNGRLVSF